MGAIAGIVSAAMTGAETGLGFIGHEADAQAAKLRGQFANDAAERNAKVAEMQGEDALNRGSLEENRMRGETAQAISSGRADTAAGGTDVGVGSAVAVRASQQLVGDVDALTIRNNAAREAWGYNVEAANDRMQGKLAELSGNNEAAADQMAAYSTLITGATSLYGQYRGTRTGTANKAGATTGRVTAPVVRNSGKRGY